MSVQMDRPAPRRFSQLHGTLLLVGGVVVALILVAFATAASLKPSVRVPAGSVTIDEVRRGDFHDTVALRGKIAPRDIVYLDALEGGQIAKIHAKAGDFVVEGQPLLEFRNTALELDVLDREGRLIESITQLQAYEKQLEDTRLLNEKAAAQIEYDVLRLTRLAARRDTLRAAGFVSQAQVDEVNDELALARKLRPIQAESNAKQEGLRKRQLPHIQEELAQMRESLAITRAKLDNLMVRAPVAGRLTDLDADLGVNVNRGSRIGEIVPNTGFKVAATLDEFYLGRVRVGQDADVVIDGRSWRLRIERIYPQVKDGVFIADLLFQSKPPVGLSQGAAVQGKLLLGGDRPALLLPVAPFLQRTGGNWVMVVAPGGRRAERRAITIGRRNSDQVEVVGGLKPGERVVTSDYAAFEKVDRVDFSN